MILEDLQHRAIQSACLSLKDPGPPLNPGLFTEKGYALIIDDQSMNEPGTAALSLLKEIDETIHPEIYCLFMEQLVELPDKDPVNGIVIVSGGRGLPPQENKLFIYSKIGGEIVFEEPPMLFDVGPSPNLFDCFDKADASPEWIWKEYSETGSETGSGCNY